MRCKTITGCDIDPPEVLAPPHLCSSTNVDLVEKLLVPAECAEKLGSEFVLRFQVVSERIRITNTRNFETRFIKLRPQLQMMPGNADVLAQNQFPIIADITTERQAVRGFGPEIWPIAYGNTKVPHLIRPKTQPRIESRMVKIHFGRVPRFGTRRK